MASEFRTAWRILVVLCLAGCTAAQGPDDLDGIGRAVASNLDSTNGFPTAVLDEHVCQFRVEPCRDREGHLGASLIDASTLVSAFAEAVRIPVERYSGHGPRCEWDETSDAVPVGLWAEFLEPEIQGDSARVELYTRCSEAGAAFEQLHEFVLERNEEGVWEVASRRLRSIT